MIRIPTTSESKPYLSFRGLGKQFSHEWAIREISGDIKKGSKIAILGKNGAGKSTLLGLLAGFYTPTRGNIYFSEEKNISFIGHESMFYPKLTLLENLFFFQTLCPESKISDAKDSLELTDLYDFRNEKVQVLSYGMKKRLGMARMILQKASLLILDESFVGLDLKGKKLLSSIVQNKGLPEMNWLFDTLLLVEHEMNHSLEFCNEFWLLKKGELVEIFLKQDNSSKEIRQKIMFFFET